MPETREPVTENYLSVGLLIQTLGQIANHCIDPDAHIEPGCTITLETSPDGKRFTRIGAAYIGRLTRIEALAHISDGARFAGGKDALVGFRANVGRADIGHNAVVQCGARIEDDVTLGDSALVDNFSYVESGAIVETMAHVKPNASVRSGVRIGIGSVVSGSISVIAQ